MSEVKYRIVIREEAQGKAQIVAPQDLELLTVATGKLEDIYDFAQFAGSDGSILEGIIVREWVIEGEEGRMRAILTPYDRSALVYGCEIEEVVAEFTVKMEFESVFAPTRVE